MWSAGFPSLEIERQSSAEHGIAALCIAVAVLIPWLLPLSAGNSLLAGLAAGGVVGIFTWRTGLWGSRFVVRRFRCKDDGEWELIGADGSRQPAGLLPATRVTPHLIWLHWRGEFGTRQMLILRWVSAARGEVDSWRRLTVRLRLGASKSGGSKSLKVEERDEHLRVARRGA